MSGAMTHRACDWVYRGVWGVLARFFDVPREPPALPTRGGKALDQRRPSEAWLRYRKFWFWIVLGITDVCFIFIWVIIFTVNKWVALSLSPVFIVLIVLPDIIAYVALHLRYDTTWYVFSDRSVRIRRGVWVIHETTATFENIQDVQVRQGPVQRHFGFADLLIKTAGGGGTAAGTTMSGHSALIEGVHDANELRDLIMDRVRASKSAGLGDEAEAGPGGRSASGGGAGGAGFTAEHVAVLREIAAAARGLAG